MADVFRDQVSAFGTKVLPWHGFHRPATGRTLLSTQARRARIQPSLGRRAAAGGFNLVREANTASVNAPSHRLRQPACSLIAGLLAAQKVRHVAAIALIWLVVAAFFWPLLTPDPNSKFWVQVGDFTNQFYAFHSFAAQELWAGRLPLWNPYMLAGHPFLSDIQTATFYPVGLLSARLLGQDGFSLAELQYRAVLAYPLGATFCYILLWQLTHVRAAGILSGLVFALGGFLTSYPLQQLPILETAIWLPLVLFFVERSASSPAPAFWVLSAAATLAVALFAGHPQTFLYIAYTATAYLAVRRWSASDAVSTPRRLWRWSQDCLWQLGLLWFFVIALAAVQLLPTAEFIPLSSRGGLTYAEAAVGYSPDSLVAILLPDLKGEHGPYISLLGLSLAIVGFCAGQRPSRWFWLGSATIAALLSLGGNGPLYPLFHAVAPGFALFRDQERVMVVFSLSLAVLAGMGLATLSGGILAGRRYGWVAIPVVTLVLLGVELRQGGWLEPVPRQTAYAICLLAAAGLLLWRRRSLLGSLGYSALVVGLAVTDLFVVNFGSNLSPIQPPGVQYAAPAFAIAKVDAAARQQAAPFRVQTGDDSILPPNYGHLLDVQQIGGDTPLQQRRLDDLRKSKNEWRLWQLLNVVYTVSRRDLGGGLDPVGQAGDLRVSHVQWPVPRIWATRDLRFAADEKDALSLTLAPDLAPGTTAILEGSTWLQFPDTQKPLLKSHIVKYEPQEFSAVVELNVDALCVFSEAYYPGWRAFVDGRETPLYRSDYYLRALVVPAGAHTLDMVYDPQSVKVGMGISGAALLLWLTGIVLSRRHRKGVCS